MLLSHVFQVQQPQLTELPIKKKKTTKTPKKPQPNSRPLTPNSPTPHPTTNKPKPHLSLPTHRPKNRQSHTNSWGLRDFELLEELFVHFVSLSRWAVNKSTLQYYPYWPLPSSSYPVCSFPRRDHIFDLLLHKKGKPILLPVLKIG